MSKKMLTVIILFLGMPVYAQVYFIFNDDSTEHKYVENTRHPAVKPYAYTLQDTFFTEPELLVCPAYSDVAGYLVAGGIKTFYAKSKFSAQTRLITVFYKPIAISQNFFDTTGIIPAIGKARNYGGINALTDPIFTLSYNSKYIVFSAGRDKFSVGESYYSVLRSGISPATPFVQADVDIWKIKYVYRIDLLQNPDLRFPRKDFSYSYNFTHFFDFAIWNWLNLTLFETAVQDPVDSLGARRGLDINYLNPVAFFRSVDLSLGSPDNILLGLGGSIRIKKSVVLYGYGILDEMVVSHLIAGDGYWGLKYGLQAGAKVYSPFIKGLFLQGEISTVRPYTFSHANPVLAYGTLYHPLGHPLGSNFYQALANLYYSNQKIEVNAYASYSIYGKDDSLNYGNNIFLSYLTRAKEFNVYTTQGIKTEMIYGYINAGYKFDKYKVAVTVGLRRTQNKTETLTEPFVSVSVSTFNPGKIFEIKR